MPRDWEAEAKAKQQVQEWFKEHSSEYFEFERVEPKLHRRRDIHAFLLLDSLQPADRDIVAGADHDEIYLGTKVDEIAPKLTSDIVRDLVRCGVRYDGDGFKMFV